MRDGERGRLDRLRRHFSINNPEKRVRTRHQRLQMLSIEIQRTRSVTKKKMKLMVTDKHVLNKRCESPNVKKKTHKQNRSFPRGRKDFYSSLRCTRSISTTNSARDRVLPQSIVGEKKRSREALQQSIFLHDKWRKTRNIDYLSRPVIEKPNLQTISEYIDSCFLFYLNRYKSAAFLCTVSHH